MGELYNPFPKLPKNIRQIGDSDQVVRFYMEDYVNTYLKRLYPTGKQTMRVGVLLGSVEQYEGIPYVFVDGALEMEDVETNGEKIILSESSWKKVYRQIEDSFPKRTIQGWFLCGGPGSQLSPLNYWKQHGQYFAGKHQLMYLNHGLEGDEAIYITSEDGFYRLKGHCIYYERNQMMQDYMITRKDVHRVESGAQETVIRDFRSRLTAKKEQAVLQTRANHVMGMVCGVLAVAVLASGVVLVNNYSKMQQMESVLASVLPAGAESWDEYRKDQTEGIDFIIEEIKGSIRPTEAEKNDEKASETETAEQGQRAASAASSMAQPSDQRSDKPSDKASDKASDKPSKDISNMVSSEEPAETTQPLIGIGKESGQGDEAGSHGLAVDHKAAAVNGYRIYEVGKGETLYGICWNVYGSLDHLTEICSLNNLTDVDRILAGQKLIMP